MRKSKKISVVIILLVVGMLLFTGCGSTTSNADVGESIAASAADAAAEQKVAEGEVAAAGTLSRESSEQASPQNSTPEVLQSTTQATTAQVAEQTPTPQTPEPDMALEVHFIDVGQGDSTLITSGEFAMLIDAGDNSSGTLVQSYLQKRGVTHLDYLILTHTDADHIGGADVVITKFDIDTVFMGDYAKDNATYRDVIQALDDKSLSWSTPNAGESYTLGNASFTIIAPNGSYDSPNNTSIGLLLTNGGNKFLFTGDAEEEAEEDIVKNGLNIDADVYQVGHHGSRTSSTEALLDVATPAYAVISCAEGNSYGHPHSQTLNNLRARGVQVFRTDEQGSIVASSDGSSITWNCAPSETWQAGEPTQSAEQTPVVEAPVVEETPVITEAPTAEPPSGSSYILNTNTKKFHYPSCSSVDQMSEKNKKESTQTRDEIIAQGYAPCKRCNP